jgi:hypothetical protein
MRRVLLCAAIGAAAVASGCGGEDSGTVATTTASAGENAAKYTGPKRDIATVIDQLQADARSGDADAICHELFTDKLSGTIASRNGTSCAGQVKTKIVRDNAKFGIASIKIRGDKAVAKVTDFTGTTNGMYFVNQDGWKIDSIYSLQR